MEHIMATLLRDFEQGKMTRRQLTSGNGGVCRKRDAGSRGRQQSS
jgi:hypothetical protein